MEQSALIPHLFRTEFRKITAVLCKHFGIGNIQVAEDIASDTFISAVEVWPFKGVPLNPTAWLYTVAKNKALNYINHQTIFRDKIASDISQKIKRVVLPDIDLTEENITDSQLKMLFALCHPALSPEEQIGLSLRILCGFGITEIANAFLTNKETVNKRLFRARQKLREENITIELPSPLEINKRLGTVLTTLYLLFNEGYYSESGDIIIRKDLCLEAMRLTYFLLENNNTNKPEVNALFSLMCFHSSRLDARRNDRGEVILYADQNEDLWNHDLIGRGAYYFQQSALGKVVSKYHMEAGIAFWHTVKTDSKEKWESILRLYNQLLRIEYSPVAALNRTYALAKANGTKDAIIEAEKLALTDNHFYFVLLGELYKETDPEKALGHFQQGMALAKTVADKQTIQRQIDNLRVSKNA